MSEIDPWALPQGGNTTVSAGLPNGGYIAPQPVQPLNPTLPFVVIGFGILYVLVSIVQIFIYNSQVSVANQINAAIANPGSADSSNLVTQAQNSDNNITTVSWIALGVFVGTLIAISVWQKSLNATFGSVGARQAVFKRAGYQYFRGAWLVSLVLSLFLNATGSINDTSSIQDVINHDHQYMLYYGVRAVVGLVLIFFAFRLKKISAEGIARLSGAYLPVA